MDFPANAETRAARTPWTNVRSERMNASSTRSKKAPGELPKNATRYGIFGLRSSWPQDGQCVTLTRAASPRQGGADRAAAAANTGTTFDAKGHRVPARQNGSRHSRW